MLKIYNTDIETNKFEEINEIKKGCWVNLVNPSEAEIGKVCKELKIEEEFIRYPLDFEEQARIDIDEDENITLFVVDVPIIEEIEDDTIYTTMPLGIITVRDEAFITISLKKNKVIDTFEKGKIKGIYTYKKTRFLLQILYVNSSCYLENLKKINKEAEITVTLLQKSMKNRELIQLLNLENSLVYITTALKSNQLVMEKILRGKIIKLYDEDEDILDDAMIENRQAIEMSQIYSDILSGTMDASASMISNNLNVVMKFLTAITIVISVPTLIASIWGMNVKLPFSGSPHGFIIILAISMIISLIAYVWLRKKDML